MKKNILIQGLVLGVCACLGLHSLTPVPVWSRVTMTEPPRVILDAGHGGTDGGAVGAAGSIEQKINLAIVRKTEYLLAFMGVSTCLTRENEESIGFNAEKSIRENKVADMHARAELAKALPEALFVSIHQNKFTEEKYSGAQVFYSPNNENSRRLAVSLQNALQHHVTQNKKREIKQAGAQIYLMKVITNPAVIVETGFLSNVQEEKLLNEQNYQKKLALALCHGIYKYLQNEEV